MAHTVATSSSERNAAHLPWIRWFRWFRWRKFRAEHYWLRPLFGQHILKGMDATGNSPISHPSRTREPRTPFEEKYLAEARRICLAEVTDPRYEIFLFGSRARGHCEHGSDVDIGISGPEPLPEGTSHLLWLLTESDVPWRCQVVDFTLVADEKFRKHAYEDHEIWRAAN